jgi:hypothetical protein
MSAGLAPAGMAASFAALARMSHKRGYARLATRYGDIRDVPRNGPACRCAHAGYRLAAASWPVLWDEASRQAQKCLPAVYRSPPILACALVANRR